MIWEADNAFVHRPHPKQRPRPGFAYNPQILGRKEAFEALKGEWDHYFHTGDVPSPPDGVQCEGVGDASLMARTAPHEHPIQAVAAAPVRNDIPRLDTNWILDSGASYDLVSQADVATFSRHVRRSPNPITLLTANGVVPATKSITLDIPGLEDNPEHYVLQSTPNALSMGIRCMKHG